MDKLELIKSVLPPNDFDHRSEFNNTRIIDSLTDQEKKVVEDEFCKRLENDKDVDVLIVETLAYLKSKDAVELLRSKFNTQTNPMIKLIIASSIYEISKDSNVINGAVSAFNELPRKYQIIPALYYLSKIGTPEVKGILEKLSENPDYLISYNAKSFLDSMTINY